MNRYSLPIAEAADAPAATIDLRDQQEPFEGPRPIRPPQGAPNVLIVLIDDMGFGASSAFGGPCRMPTADRLSETGIRYSRFHTTALCGATRTALLTGRNHHTCGMGTLPETSTTAPGYTGVRPRSVATIAQILSYNGYATGAFGKMHQTPVAETTPAGPYDHWPTHEGFDRFYGFLGAETNQFTPNLIDGVTPVDPPQTEAEGYHLSEDLVDQATSWIGTVSALDPQKPWFCYLSYGACHTPFHLPASWRTRYRNEFGHGWDRQRELTLERQKELGVVPPDATLAPWSPGVPHWDDLNATERAVAERLMETYAAFAEHTDVQTGRLIEALERWGQLEKTLVLYVLGDNGASAEGGLAGTLNEMIGVNGLRITADQISERLDEIGGPRTYSLYPVGWALAMDTPYQWTKQVASHYGGTRNGLIVHWPAGIPSGGEVRHQWHHCIDIVPTVLEAAKIPQPESVDGVAQRPIEGTSFLYTFADADAPERHTTQYFEMFGNRGIYHHGWTAVAMHRTPWEMAAQLQPLAADRWELYDTNTDWTQAHDVAAEFPERLAALQQLFIAEASKYQVLPIDDRLSERMNPRLAPRHDLMTGRREMTMLPGMAGLRESAAPNLKNVSFTVAIDLAATAEDQDGVLVAQGGRFGGWSIYVQRGVLMYCYNLCDLERTYVRGDRSLAPGEHSVVFSFAYDGGGVGRGGMASICLDGLAVGSGRVERTVAFSFSVDETLDIGCDRGTPVTDEYPEGHNAYDGIIRSVRFALGDDAESPAVGEIMRAALVSH